MQSIHVFDVEDGSALVWYRRSGCVAIHGKLYYVTNEFTRTCWVLERAAAEHRRAMVHYFSMRCERCPTREYFVDFSFDMGPDPAWTDGRFTWDGRAAGTGVQERTWTGRKRRFINEIHPAFVRLQRWWRRRAKLLAACRQERWAAVCMGLHVRLGGGSCLAGVPEELVWVILGHSTA